MVFKASWTEEQFLECCEILDREVVDRLREQHKDKNVFESHVIAYGMQKAHNSGIRLKSSGWCWKV